MMTKYKRCLRGRSKLEWPVGKKLDAARRNEIVLLESNAEAKLFVVESGLDGQEIAFRENVVPTGIEVRTFLRREPDAVA
jgi:hypothetical protein